MTDTLTSERSIAQVRCAATGWLPETLAHGSPDESSNPSDAVDDWAMAVASRYPSLRKRKGLPDRLHECPVGFQPNAMFASTFTRRISPSESRGFEALALILAFLQELARNNWSPHFFVSDEESPIPVTSENFLFPGREAFSWTCAPCGLGEWARVAYRLATALLPADVDAPHKVADPENEAEWWLAIVAKCRGNVASVMRAYNELAERFVAEVPAQARDRIRFEIRLDD